MLSCSRLCQVRSGNLIFKRNASLLLCEHVNGKVSAGTLSALNAAQQHLSKPIHAVVASPSAEVTQAVGEELKKYTVEKVIVGENAAYEHPLSTDVASLVKSVVDKTGPYRHIVAPHSTFGRDLAPRVAGMLNTQQVSDVIKIEKEDTFVRPVYAGNALVNVTCAEKQIVLTIRTTAFQPLEAGSSESAKDAAIEKVDAPVPSGSIQWVKDELSKSDRPELGSAKIVIAGGRGLKSGDNFKLLYDLADKLGAAVGASRAAVDSGFVPNDLQIGQTGKNVAPQLYIAVGISGAIQHLAGMKDSKVIVAINKDADAPIFSVSDYGLVGDLFTVVPEMTQKV
ncbi:hypothetical protein MIR68_007036 [Amoeboaphelidium protococcarum]|nr:hypothetical protein MIR68_007036 [Amoeboaphelidium protococcarum]